MRNKEKKIISLVFLCFTWLDLALFEGFKPEKKRKAIIFTSLVSWITSGEKWNILTFPRRLGLNFARRRKNSLIKYACLGIVLHVFFSPTASSAALEKIYSNCQEVTTARTEPRISSLRMHVSLCKCVCKFMKSEVKRFEICLETVNGEHWTPPVWILDGGDLG